MKKPALVVLAILGVVASLAAQGAAPRAAAPTPAELAAQAAAAERGRVIFKENCSACHAEDATGGRGPDLIRSSLVRHDKGGDLIGVVVTGGRPDKGMPPFPMTQSQISDIVAFLNAQISLFDLHTRYGPYPNDIPAERLATGTVEAVSYTHLDVYKRQAYPDPKFRSEPRGNARLSQHHRCDQLDQQFVQPDHEALLRRRA